MAPQDKYSPTHEEWKDLNDKVNDIHTALIGNNLGTVGVIKRLSKAEAWISSAKIRLAVISAGVAGGATAFAEAIKAAFLGAQPPPGH
jgi:hypothetical protein